MSEINVYKCPQCGGDVTITCGISNSWWECVKCDKSISRIVSDMYDRGWIVKERENFPPKD